MSATLLTLVAGARRANVAITRDGDRLAIDAPPELAQLAKALRARTYDLLTVLDLYDGAVDHLNWRTARVLDTPQPCTLCGRDALLIEPFDGSPCHKTCAETVIRLGTLPAARTRKRAA